MSNKPTKWVSSLREKIRKKCGEGWMIRGIGNGLIQKVQLTVRFKNGSRSSIILGPKSKRDPDFVPWVGTSADWILNIVTDISKIMESQGKGLAEAYEMVKENKDNRFNGNSDWRKLFEEFKLHKTSTSKKGLRVWNRNYRSPIDRTLRILTTDPAVCNGYTLLKTLVDLHGGEPGSASRRLRVQYAAEFLRFAFKNGANRSWMPPEDLSIFIGEKTFISQVD